MAVELTRDETTTSPSRTGRDAARNRVRAAPLQAAGSSDSLRAAEAAVRPSSRSLDIVFEVLLAVAACLSLVAVVQQAISSEAPDPTAPEADPPAVIVQID